MSAPTKSIAEARERNLWLVSINLNFWFSPDELDDANAKGKILWPDENWELRPPQELLDQELERLKDAQEKYTDVANRISAWRQGIKP